MKVLLLGRQGEVRGDARTNLASAIKMAAGAKSALTFHEITSARQLKSAGSPDVVVDAIFGTGFSGEVSGIQREAIEWINRAGAYVASVDIASGVDATTGIVENVAVKADLTVSMGLAKIGHVTGPGREHSGELVVVDISIPAWVYQPSRFQAYKVNLTDVRQVLPVRPLTAHKYSVGKVFVLAGSRNFTGAPFMCAQSALKAGAGAVILGVPRSIHSTLTRKLTEVIVSPLDETTDGTVSHSAMDKILEKVDWADVVVVGPGLSRNSETDRVILELVPTIRKPLVLDADGLNALVSHTQLLRKRIHETILTPHGGELSRLTGEGSQHIELHRVDAARNAAKLLSSVVILKGSPTATATPEGEVFVNSTGNPGMATIGSGDVLTGLVAGLRAQGMEPHTAAYAAVFLHGKAGDMAAVQLGQRSLLAVDILDHLPASFKSVEP